jgi:pimeloyl-ACP methyl ester carboxylesterase
MSRVAQTETVLLLHGLWMGRWAMGWLARALRRAGFDTVPVGYRSMRGAPEQHIVRLADAVNRCHANVVHLVGHSMGGVIALRYLQGGAPPSIRRALLLGTPSLGCQAALAFERQPWGAALLGGSLELWRAPFAQALQTHAEVGAIAGNRPFGLGPLFVRLPEPSDGVVTVEETRIQGLRDHIVLPVSHTGMLMSRAVATQAVHFLKRGQFLR